MTTLFWLARLFLAGVFSVAGVAKLLDRKGTRQTLGEFGVPSALTAAGSIALPVVELALVGLLLSPASWAWWGAVSAMALLLVFSGTITYQLLRGHQPNCRCFGNLQSSPIGWKTLIRNGFLTCVAALIVTAEPERLGNGVIAGLAALTLTERMSIVGVVIVAACIAGLIAFFLAILRQQGRVLLRLEKIESMLSSRDMREEPPVELPAIDLPGLPAGSPAPDFEVRSESGSVLTLANAFSGKIPVLLLFTNPRCGPCQELMPDVVRWQREYAWRVKIALISEGKAEENRAKIIAHGASHVYLQNKREVAEAFQAWGTPSAVLLNLDGTIGSGVLQGGEAIRDFVKRFGSKPVKTAPALKLDDVAPQLELRDINGSLVRIGGRRESETLLLFWNSNCGFCQRMLPGLKAWLQEIPPGAPDLVIVSTASHDESRALRLPVPVVCERSAELARVFGAGGTPMAILIDRKGKIRSEVVAGATAIFELANAQQTATAAT